MESTKNHLTPTFELCQEKAAKVMQWIGQSEDLSKQTFTASLVFEQGILPGNTGNFLRVLLQEIFEEKTNQHELQPEELRDILTNAFTNTYLYLLTPQSFIPEYLSFGIETIHINVKMLSRLSSLIDYPYFPEMLREWFTITSQTIAPEDRKIMIKRFLSDTEHIIMKYSTQDVIATYLTSLYEYHGSELLDRETTEIFFSDKDLTFPKENGKNEFPIEELSTILQKAFLDAEVIASAEGLAPIPAYDSFLQELREIGVVLPAPHPRASLKEKKIFPPLELFISSKLRKKCLEKIFHQNEYEYKHFLTLLNEIDDYQQAELNLNTLLHIHKVAQDSKVAIRLTEALQLRFGITPVPEQTQ